MEQTSTTLNELTVAFIRKRLSEFLTGFLSKITLSEKSRAGFNLEIDLYLANYLPLNQLEYE